MAPLEQQGGPSQRTIRGEGENVVSLITLWCWEVMTSPEEGKQVGVEGVLTVLDHNPIAGAQHNLGSTTVPPIKSHAASIRWLADGMLH